MTEETIEMTVLVSARELVRDTLLEVVLLKTLKTVTETVLEYLTLNAEMMVRLMRISVTYNVLLVLRELIKESVLCEELLISLDFNVFRFG